MVRRGYKFLHTSKIQDKIGYTILLLLQGLVFLLTQLLVDITRLSELQLLKF